MTSKFVRNSAVSCDFLQSSTPPNLSSKCRISPPICTAIHPSIGIAAPSWHLSLEEREPHSEGQEAAKIRKNLALLIPLVCGSMSFDRNLQFSPVLVRIT